MKKRRTYTNDPVRPSEKTLQECFQELDQAIREFKLALAHSLGLERVVNALVQFIDRRKHANCLPSRSPSLWGGTKESGVPHTIKKEVLRMEKVKDMANQMLKELGKGGISDHPALERQLKIINTLCEKCKNPYTERVGSLTSRQVIASTIVQYFSHLYKVDLDP